MQFFFHFLQIGCEAIFWFHSICFAKLRCLLKFALSRILVIWVLKKSVYLKGRETHRLILHECFLWKIYHGFQKNFCSKINLSSEFHFTWALWSSLVYCSVIFTWTWIRLFYVYTIVDGEYDLELGCFSRLLFFVII